MTTDLEARASLLAGETSALLAAASGRRHRRLRPPVEPRLSRTWRLARAILGTDHDAGDAVQDAWLTAWRQLRHCESPIASTPGSTASSSMPAGCRSGAGVECARSASSRTSTDPSTAPGPEQLAERDALEAAFGRLSVDHRSILVLHHLEERPLAAIAEVLGIPVGTAKSRLHAARTALERALEDDR